MAFICGGSMSEQIRFNEEGKMLNEECKMNQKSYWPTQIKSYVINRTS